MLKIREDLKTVEEVREEVQDEFKYVTNTDRPVMREFKEEVISYMVNNDWARLKELYNKTGDASLTHGIDNLVSDIKNEAFEGLWSKLDWDKLDKAEDLVQEIELRDLEEQAGSFTMLKNEVYISNNMIETIYKARGGSYVAGLIFGDAINKEIDSARFWFEEVLRELDFEPSNF